MSIYEAVPDFGDLYDAVPAYTARADAAFYLAEAAAATGEVLELGCGTGRILLPLARAGHRVSGVDASPSMLARCRAKLDQEPEPVRAAVTLVQADIRDLTGAGLPPGGFGLAIAPFRVIQHLTAPADQVRFLTGARRLLSPGGRLAFDVFNPNFRLMTQDRSVEVEDTAERRLPDGRSFSRTVRVPRMRWADQVSDVELIYYLRSGEAVERIVQAFEMRWYGPAELEHLLARTGFELSGMYGNFDRTPLRDESPEIVVVAARAS
jgi:SAM-dependent methyltransferase